jgi:hypothetical protein
MGADKGFTPDAHKEQCFQRLSADASSVELDARSRTTPTRADQKRPAPRRAITTLPYLVNYKCTCGETVGRWILVLTVSPEIPSGLFSAITVSPEIPFGLIRSTVAVGGETVF